MDDKEKEEINNIYKNIIWYRHMNKLKLRNFLNLSHAAIIARVAKMQRSSMKICTTILSFFFLLFCEWNKKRTWTSQCKIELAQTKWSNGISKAQTIGLFFILSKLFHPLNWRQLRSSSILDIRSVFVGRKGIYGNKCYSKLVVIARSLVLISTVNRIWLLVMVNSFISH